MKITEDMVETALITWFKNEVSWDKGMAPWSADQFRVEMRATLEAALSAIEPAGVGVETRTFNIGDMVRKRSGSWWEGRVVGFYSTEQTPDGVCVQLDKPMGPVQIYPAAALTKEDTHD